MFKALIIDDEKPARTVISALGRWAEYGVERPYMALDGEDGLRNMREIRPDIVFVDINMPKMDGIEFMALAMKEFPRAKIIVISGYDQFEYAVAALKFGAIDYILKPIAEDALNSAIEKAALALGGAQTEAERTSAYKPDEVIEIIKNYIDKYYNEEIKISMFSEQYYFSKEYLSKLFKQKYNKGIYEYAQAVRMKRAAELLSGAALPIQAVAERLGYSNSNYFSKAFKHYYGMPPSEFRDQSSIAQRPR